MKTLLLLLGPKGSGKTHIGSLLQRRLGFHFLRVEDLFRTLATDDPLHDEAYITAGYRLVETAVRKELLTRDFVIIESTGIAPQFDAMTRRLKDTCNVVAVRITAGSATCRERIRTRDGSVHIPMSDHAIEAINEASRNLERPYDWVFDNEQAPEEEIVAAFRIAFPDSHIR